jgi:hypothetical protein
MGKIPMNDSEYKVQRSYTLLDVKAYSFTILEFLKPQ